MSRGGSLPRLRSWGSTPSRRAPTRDSQTGPAAESWASTAPTRRRCSARPSPTDAYASGIATSFGCVHSSGSGRRSGSSPSRSPAHPSKWGAGASSRGRRLGQPRRIGRRSVRGSRISRVLDRGGLAEVERDLAAIGRDDVGVDGVDGLISQPAGTHLARLERLPRLPKRDRERRTVVWVDQQVATVVAVDVLEALDRLAERGHDLAESLLRHLVADDSRIHRSQASLWATGFTYSSFQISVVADATTKLRARGGAGREEGDRHRRLEWDRRGDRGCARP